LKINHMSTCTTQEFKFKNKNLNFALARINGRYPEVGQALNLKCDMVYYCLAGQGTVSLTGRKKKIKPGQALLVGKNKKYYVIGKKLAVLIISNPVWDKRQYRTIKPINNTVIASEQSERSNLVVNATCHGIATSLRSSQ